MSSDSPAADREISLRALVKKVPLKEVIEVLRTTDTISSRCEIWQLRAAGGAVVKTCSGKRLFSRDWRQVDIVSPSDGDGSATITGDLDIYFANIRLSLEHARGRWPALFPDQQDPPCKPAKPPGRPPRYSWFAPRAFGRQWLSTHGRPRDKIKLTKAVEQWFIDKGMDPPSRKQIEREVTSKLLDQG